jgi:secondary thiamine-phosphate synthase enzyme
MMADLRHPDEATAMRQQQKSIEIATRGEGLYEITGAVTDFVREAGIATGLVTAFCGHTSCSLILNENADPDVRTDLIGFFKRVAPQNMDWIVHRTEGPDDMPAHIRTALTQSSISIPVRDGAAAFGTWQGLYLFEHRARPHRRQVILHIVGE